MGRERRKPEMSDERKQQPPKVEELELSKETIEELGEGEAENAQGGARGALPSYPVVCISRDFNTCLCP
jgi:hypothetical protein